MHLRASLIAVVVVAAGCGDDSDIISSTGQSTAPAGPAATVPTAPAPTETAPPVAEAEPGERIPPIPQREAAAESPYPELFFLFPEEADARAAATELEEHGYMVRTAPPADDVPEWSVIAEGTPTGKLETAEVAFRAWAQARNGRYDGNEVPVGP